jgi:hypothetical protein
MKPVWVALLVVAVLALGAVSAPAQPVISAKSGVIAYVEGKVYLGDQLLEPSPTRFPEVKENAVVRTAEGRAEVLLTPGVILRLGENASFRMITNRLIDTRLEMLTGSAVVEADEIAKDTNVTLVVKDAAVGLFKKGVFRFDMEPARIKVFDGLASVKMAGQTIEVTGGKMLNLSGEVASLQRFDKEDTDALDRWSKRRAEYLAMANVSSAKQVRDAGCNGYSFVSPRSTTGPCPCTSGWRYNPWYGLITYIPCNGTLMSPYGYRFWSPFTVARAYYVPPPVTYGGGGNSGGYYPSMGSTSGGYSGSVAASSSSVSSSPSSAASSGSTAASSAASSSVGAGASGGGRGK